MNRRKFLSYMGCGCCGLIFNSCSTAPITERRQFKIIPESKLNAQAEQVYEQVKKKEKKPPQFLSTHPSSSTRIDNLTEWINEVIIKYPPIKRT